MSHAEIQHEFQIYPSDRVITVQIQQRRISSSDQVSPEGGGVELQLLEPPPGEIETLLPTSVLMFVVRSNPRQKRLTRNEQDLSASQQKPPDEEKHH